MTSRRRRPRHRPNTRRRRRRRRADARRQRAADEGRDRTATRTHTPPRPRQPSHPSFTRTLAQTRRLPPVTKMDRPTLAQHHNPIRGPRRHTERSPHAHRIPRTPPRMRKTARTKQGTRTSAGVSVDARHQSLRPTPPGEKHADRPDRPRSPIRETERSRRPTTATPSAPLDGTIAKQKGVPRRLPEMRNRRGATAGRHSWINERTRPSGRCRQQCAERTSHPDSSQPIPPVPSMGEGNLPAVTPPQSPGVQPSAAHEIRRPRRNAMTARDSNRFGQGRAATHCFAFLRLPDTSGESAPRCPDREAARRLGLSTRRSSRRRPTAHRDRPTPRRSRATRRRRCRSPRGLRDPVPCHRSPSATRRR